MRASFGVIGVLVFLVVVLAPLSAAACSCISSGPACQAYWTTDAVFDGTVARIVPVPRVETIEGREFVSEDLLLTLRVHRAWKGVQPGDIEVTTSSNGGACGYEFKKGERYLVFAHQWRGRLNVSICSLTQRFDASARTAEFLASLERPPVGGRVFGTVRTWQRGFDHGRSDQQVDTVATVRLTGGGRELTTRSVGGRYEVELETPVGFTTYARTRTVENANRRACGEEAFTLSPDGDRSDVRVRR